MIIILEFHEREEIIPVVLPLIDKEVEELFQLLINPFHLPISLRVVAANLTLRSQYSSFVNSTTNWGPLSDTTLLGKL